MPTSRLRWILFVLLLSLGLVTPGSIARADNMGCCVLSDDECTTATRAACRALGGSLQGVGTQICDADLGCVRGTGCAKCFGGAHDGELCETPDACGPEGMCMAQTSMEEPGLVPFPDPGIDVPTPLEAPDVDPSILDLRLRDLQLRPLQQLQFAVKFVCGDPAPRGVELGRGRYATAINVHNPSLDEPAAFRFKVAVALPRVEEGPISEFRSVRLSPDGAVEIDCPTIQKMAEDPIFAKGFVVIVTTQELDVVAVYTAASPDPDGGRVKSLDVETIEPRRTPFRLRTLPAPLPGDGGP